MFKKNETGPSGETLTDEGEAGCFFHPRKKAHIPCSACGRFICALCDMEIKGQHLCPLCLESGQKKKTIRDIEKSRVLYDSIALSLSFWPLLFFFITVITAPVAIYLVIRYWNAPSSIVGRTKFRFIAAFIIAAIQILGWLIFLYHTLVS